MIAIQELYLKERQSLPTEERREIFLTADMIAGLNERRERTHVPVNAQILQALDLWLETEPNPRTHRGLVGTRDHRKLLMVPERIWNVLKERKDLTPFDLNEQVQIAVALYLETAESKNKPIVAQNETPSSRLDLDELRFALQQLGIKPEKPDVQVSPVVKMVPQIMELPCGIHDDLENLILTFGDDSEMAAVTGELAKLVTEHSFVARARGWSMANGDLPDDINPNDLLLMTPLVEFPGEICAGTIVFAKVRYKSQRIVWTLKTYTGKCLKANNPRFKSIDFGDDIESVQVIAICRGKLPVVWK